MNENSAFAIHRLHRIVVLPTELCELRKLKYGRSPQNGKVGERETTEIGFDPALRKLKTGDRGESHVSSWLIGPSNQEHVRSHALQKSVGYAE